jgi:hypothetical protein
MIRVLLGLMTVTVLGLVGCTSDPEGTAPAKLPVAAALPGTAEVAEPMNAPSTEPVEKRFAGLVLTIPAGWIEKPVASDVLQGEYQLPGDAGPARLTLSSTGGGLEANLDRWRGQIQRRPTDPDPQEETIAVGGREAVLLEVTGQFQDQFSGGGLKSDWTLLGAAIPTGPAHFFLKMTGPRETVAEHREAFRQLVTSARLDD